MARGEFDLIYHFKKLYGLDKVGDDCAVLPMSAERDLLIAADMLVEDIDFRLAWANPEYLGHKALAVSLSDIAAMGGTPRWAMLSLAIPAAVREATFLDEFYRGWHELAGRFGVELVGGDISSTEGKFVIDSIIGGDVAKGKAVLRSTANPGDLIYVSGELGGAAAGLKILEGDRKSDGSASDIQNFELMKKQLAPMPLTHVGIELGTGNIASAMIDISDGLSSDLHHLCDSGGVGAIIHANALPTDPRLESETAEERLRLALSGGEDLALLFTTAPANRSAAENIGARMIGEITSEREVRIVIDGRNLPLKPDGFRHF